MDLVKKQLEKLGRGDITTMYGLLVWRIGNGYLVGETVNQRKDTRLTLNEAAERICELAAERC